MLIFLCALLLTVVGLLCIVLLSFVYLCYLMCIAVLHTSIVGLLARSQYSEGCATGHLSTGFSWFPCVCKWMLRWFWRVQFATACFSCSPPDLNVLDPYFIYVIFISYLCTCIITTATGWQPICSQIYYIYIYTYTALLKTLRSHFWWATVPCCYDSHWLNYTCIFLGF